MRSGMFSIRLEGIGMIRGDTAVVSNINYTFPTGGVTVLLGFSGSGKSTLLKIASGLLLPTEGNLYINSTDFTRMSRKDEEDFRKESGFVFQDSALWANRSAFQNVALPLEVHYPQLSREEVRRRVMDALKETGYRDKPERRPSEISGGEQKMVAISRAIVCRPKLLFIDTPLLNLDSVAEKRIFDLLKRLKAEGTAMIICSASSRIVSMLADYLLIVHEGSIVEAGAFSEVRQSGHPVTREVIASTLDHASSYDDDILDLLGDG
jgi:phospholipid/cholesterol/gamma-HCH transport system ATP-binding protein